MNGWVFNQVLAWFFLGFGPFGGAGTPNSIYDGLVKSGVACYEYHPELNPAGPGAPIPPQPACFYDPKNTNPGN